MKQTVDAKRNQLLKKHLPFNKKEKKKVAKEEIQSMQECAGMCFWEVVWKRKLELHPF